MTLLAYPKKKGNLYSLTSVTLVQGAEVFKGLRSMKVNATIEGRDLVYGNGIIAFGRPSGTLKIEIEWKFIAEAFFDFQRAHPQFLTEVFNPAFAFEDGTRRDRMALVSATIEGAEITAEGTDAAEVSCTGTAIDVLMGPNKVSLAARQAGDISAGNAGADGGGGGLGFEASISIGFG